ncbi:GAF domain-containing sensor histidine kinase [Egbenema bharatensis]|uniref:GAF domain-containing sensor histidine kinase n=1 Tax=Egbenema bharatensis TaxID=3463334 RepID=UPI003A8B35E3
MLQDFTQIRSPQFALDDLVRLAAQICQAPFAWVTAWEGDRLSVVAFVGLAPEALPLDSGFCSWMESESLFIADTLADPAFAHHPAVTAPPHIRAYGGVALLSPQGENLGALCVLDQIPRPFDPTQVDALHALSHQIAVQFALQRHVNELEQTLHQVQQYSDNLEAQVQQRTQELASTLLLAEAANQHKTEFLANVSHELRTPLTTILGFARLLHDQIHGSLTPKQMQYVNLIHTSGQHLLNLINDLLDLSKVEAGRMELDLQAVSPVDLCERVLMLMQERSHDRNITLTFENQLPDRIRSVLLDDRKVYQILVNLVSNAIKFTPTHGQVNLRLSLDKDSMLNFSVTDTGIGIPPEQQGKIFEAFYQVENSMQRQTGGTGLGLALCRQFAKLMNGSIRLESQVNQGSTFSVQIPLHANPIAPTKIIQPTR